MWNWGQLSPRCTGDGDTGPPCSAQHGGTVHLAITFNHTGLAEGGLRQTAGATAKSGVLSFIEAPWATLDSRACDYLDTSGKPGKTHNAKDTNKSCSKSIQILLRILKNPAANPFKSWD